MESINEQIAYKLRNIRKSKGLSLDNVAELTGVSKAMLGQIERGASNPTVSVLWKIANGLKVPFSSFIEEEKPQISIVQLANIKPIIEANGDYQVYPIFPFTPDKHFEIFTVFLGPNSSHESEAHLAGVEEYITVQEGELCITIDSKTYTISEGDSIHFLADKPHSYVNNQSRQVRFQNLIYHPSS